MNDPTHNVFAGNNVRIVQQLYELFGKRDFNSILGLLSTEVEWGEPDNPFNLNFIDKKDVMTVKLIFRNWEPIIL